mgnify:CR=1 FL=1
MAEIIFHFLKVQIIMDIKKYSTQCHTQQHKDHLNVHWDTLTICQLECSYCYARNTYGREWNKLASKTVIDKVIDALSQSFLPFNLGLLGGEPTLGPHYNYIIDELKNAKPGRRVWMNSDKYPEGKDYNLTERSTYPFYIKFAYEKRPKSWYSLSEEEKLKEILKMKKDGKPDNEIEAALKKLSLEIQEAKKRVSGQVVKEADDNTATPSTNETSTEGISTFDTMVTDIGNMLQEIKDSSKNTATNNKDEESNKSYDKLKMLLKMS